MRKFVTKILKYFIIGLAILSINCSSVIHEEQFIKMFHPVWQNETFLLIDKREFEHEYSNFPILYNGEKATLYCQLHYKWEIITARYNIDTERYDYLVIDHNKQL